MRSKSGERQARGMGFKNRQVALDTLKMLDGHEYSYQYDVITNFVKHAKSALEDTQDEKKLADLRDALKIFEDWLVDFKNNRRFKEEYIPYLNIRTITASYNLAKKYGVWDDKFFEAYKNVNGDINSLCETQVPGADVTWDIERNRRLKEIICRMKDNHISLYEDDDIRFRVPTKEHVQCIVLAYSPDPNNVYSSLCLSQCEYANFSDVF